MRMMYYDIKTIHRIREQFLIIGAHDIEEIRQKRIFRDRFVEVSMDALSCLQYFPNIEYLILTSGLLNTEDLLFLSNINIRGLKIDYYSYEIDAMTIDLSLFPAVEVLFARTQYCFKNIAMCHSLKTLIVQEWLTSDLDYLSDSSIMALKLLSGKLQSLYGIERMPKLISLSLSNQRQLSDCTHLRQNQLESIELISCNKVDISCLPMLPDVRLAHLSGKKSIPDVNAILDHIPKLEWLWLDYKVESGDLSPLEKMRHAVIFVDCRHYSHKDQDLPKAWREYNSSYLPTMLEILPEAF